MRLTEGPVPLYHQLANHLREQINSGQIKPGEALPTEDRLCEQYSVSRITVRRAMDDLIAEKKVERRRGVGTFVCDTNQAARSVSLVGSLYEALDYPKDISIEVIGRDLVQPSTRIAKLLKLPLDEDVTSLSVISYVHRTPFALTRFYLPPMIANLLDETQLGKGQPVARLVEAIINEPVTRAEQIVEPASATSHLSKQLGIAEGTALLHVLRTYFSRSNQPVEVASVYYHPDQYSLKVELVAPGSGNG
jgi:GntR family transcriptional regulator